MTLYEPSLPLPRIINILCKLKLHVPNNDDSAPSQLIAKLFESPSNVKHCTPLNPATTISLASMNNENWTKTSPVSSCLPTATIPLSSKGLNCSL